MKNLDNITRNWLHKSIVYTFSVFMDCVMGFTFPCTVTDDSITSVVQSVRARRQAVCQHQNCITAEHSLLNTAVKETGNRNKNAHIIFSSYNPRRYKVLLYLTRIFKLQVYVMYNINFLNKADGWWKATLLYPEALHSVKDPEQAPLKGSGHVTEHDLRDILSSLICYLRCKSQTRHNRKTFWFWQWIFLFYEQNRGDKSRYFTSRPSVHTMLWRKQM